MRCLAGIGRKEGAPGKSLLTRSPRAQHPSAGPSRRGITLKNSSMDEARCQESSLSLFPARLSPDIARQAAKHCSLTIPFPVAMSSRLESTRVESDLGARGIKETRESRVTPVSSVGA